MDSTRTITVIFNDTFDDANDMQSIMGALSKSAQAVNKDNVYVYGGVGKSHGYIAGGIFGVGLDAHTKELSEKIRQMIAGNNSNKGKAPIKLKIVGIGRGGISACHLVKALENVNHHDLESDLVMYDPVSLNSQRAARIDFFHWTWANIALDLQHCKHLKKVLAFYTNNFLVNFFLHMPLIPVYPKGCQVDNEILPGFNRYFTKPLYAKENHNTWSMNNLAFIVFDRMREFLYDNGNGTDFDESLENNISVGNAVRHYDPKKSNAEWLRISYATILATEKSAISILKWLNGFSRSTFSMGGAQIRTNLTDETAYLNKNHRDLNGGKHDEKIGLSMDDDILPDSRCDYSFCFFQPSAKTYLGTIGFVVGGIVGAMIVLSPLFLSAPSILTVAAYMQAHILETTILTIAGAYLGAAVGEVLADEAESCIWPNLKPI